MSGGGRGYLMLADITGYTRFLTGSELDHAQGILQDLFGALTERLQSPVVLSNVQGDAILAHAPAEQVPDGGVMLDSVEGLYCGFRERLAHMERNTTCGCAACANIPGLDLKLLTHFGDYVEHPLGGRDELSGPDVILVHRLLKNEVVARTGMAAYALFTEAAVAEIGLDDLFAGAPRYQQEDSEFGVIETRVLDMGPVWERHRVQTRVVLGPDTARWFPDISVELPAPPDVAWYYLTDPQERPRWYANVTSLDRRTLRDGRLAPGTEDHCAHGGGNVSRYTYVDILLHKHVTYDIWTPLGGAVRTSLIFEPTVTGTRVTVRMARPEAKGALRTGLLRLMAGRVVGKVVAEWRESLDCLVGYIAEQGMASGGAAPTPTVSADELAGLAKGTLGEPATPANA